MIPHVQISLSKPINGIKKILVERYILAIIRIYRDNKICSIFCVKYKKQKLQHFSLIKPNFFNFSSLKIISLY